MRPVHNPYENAHGPPRASRNLDDWTTDGGPRDRALDEAITDRERTDRERARAVPDVYEVADRVLAPLVETQTSVPRRLRGVIPEALEARGVRPTRAAQLTEAARMLAQERAASDPELSLALLLRAAMMFRPEGGWKRDHGPKKLDYVDPFAPGEFLDATMASARTKASFRGYEEDALSAMQLLWQRELWAEPPATLRRLVDKMRGKTPAEILSAYPDVLASWKTAPKERPAPASAGFRSVRDLLMAAFSEAEIGAGSLPLEIAQNRARTRSLPGEVFVHASRSGSSRARNAVAVERSLDAQTLIARAHVHPRDVRLLFERFVLGRYGERVDLVDALRARVAIGLGIPIPARPKDAAAIPEWRTAVGLAIHGPCQPGEGPEAERQTRHTRRGDATLLAVHQEAEQALATAIGIARKKPHRKPAPPPRRLRATTASENA